MRRIVAGLFMSLDGVVDGTNGWQRSYFTAEMMADISAALTDVDAALFGRVTYDHFSTIWPGQDSAVPMADFFNNSPKYVVTSSPRPLPWGPAHKIAIADLDELKAQPGKDILIGGSPRLVAALLRIGLLDELNLNIMPIAVGTGLRLFEADQPVPLTLVRTRTLGNGVITATYSRES